VNKLSLIMIFLLALLVTNLNAQASLATPSSIPVHHLAIKAQTPLRILNRLAKKYHLVIGVYGNVAGYQVPIEVKIRNGTLADVFDAIIRADQRVEWQQGSNGAVHFVVRDAPLPLMDVTVHSFDYENPIWPEITDRLRTIPEINGWLQAHKCSIADDTIFLRGKPPRRWRRFSLHAKDLPVLTILDQIAAESRTYFWHSNQTMSDPCAVTIQWWL
jgi:hypothetical protein